MDHQAGMCSYKPSLYGCEADFPRPLIKLLLPPSLSQTLHQLPIKQSTDNIGLPPRLPPTNEARVAEAVVKGEPQV